MTVPEERPTPHAYGGSLLRKDDVRVGRVSCADDPTSVPHLSKGPPALAPGSLGKTIAFLLFCRNSGEDCFICLAASPILRPSRSIWTEASTLGSASRSPGAGVAPS